MHNSGSMCHCVLFIHQLFELTTGVDYCFDMSKLLVYTLCPEKKRPPAFCT